MKTITELKLELVESLSGTLNTDTDFKLIENVVSTIEQIIELKDSEWIDCVTELRNRNNRLESHIKTLNSK